MYGTFTFGQSYFGQTFNLLDFSPLVPAFSQGSLFQGLSFYITTTLLANLTTIALTNIYDSELTDLAGYPAATVTAMELQGKVLDNTRNLRTLRFVVRVFVERNKQNFGTLTAEAIMRRVADELIYKIDADPTLGGNCLNVIPFPARFGYINRESNNVRVMEITLDCQSVVTWR